MENNKNYKKNNFGDYEHFKDSYKCGELTEKDFEDYIKIEDNRNFLKKNKNKNYQYFDYYQDFKDYYEFGFGNEEFYKYICQEYLKAQKQNR